MLRHPGSCHLVVEGSCHLGLLSLGGGSEAKSVQAQALRSRSR
jgi:hypothetical protein